MWRTNELWKENDSNKNGLGKLTVKDTKHINIKPNHNDLVIIQIIFRWSLLVFGDDLVKLCDERT